MSILTLGNKKGGKEISNQRERKKEARKFPIKEWEKAKKNTSVVLTKKNSLLS